MSKADTYTRLRQQGYSGTLVEMADLATRDSSRSTIPWFETPEFFGAVGDGVSDDSIALARTYARARSSGLPVLLTASKTYVNGATINCTGVTTYGYGAVLKHKSSMVAVNMFQSVDSGCKFFGLTIDMNKANTTDPGNDTIGCGIYVFGSSAFSDAVIRDVTVNNAHRPGLRLGTGVSIVDGKDAPDTRTILDNYRSTACRFGVFLLKIGGVSVVGGSITDAASDGFWTNLTDRLTITGLNCSDNGGHGIVVAYGNAAKLVANTCENNTQSGIALGGGSDVNTANLYFTVTGNVCKNNGELGITCDPTKIASPNTQIPTYGSIVGNTCIGNSLHGLYIHNGQYISVSGNTCSQNELSGISSDAANCAFAGNTCISNGTYGFSFNGNASYPNTGNHDISGNIASGNASANYYVESTFVTGCPLRLLGNGSPAGNVAAPVGSIYQRIDGGAGTTLYVKESGGVGNTGWVGK